ncbi:MAG: restriction endonuclease [Acidimicrobiia bacterium]|nr:restriction endonuclease [Acidimicrobiia bacterium]
MEWDLAPGDVVARKHLHDRFGGGRQGGMSPSRTSPNILLFTDPRSGERHGYYDGWGVDGAFEYTGEGQSGDQQMTRGNRALLDHGREGRAVRLFGGTGGPVRYEGEFVLDPDQPYVERMVHATGGGAERRVFVFRLRTADVDQNSSPSTSEPTIVTVPIAEQNVESWAVTPGEQTKASAVESMLVRRFQDYLRAKGDTVGRRRYKSSSGHLYNDVFNETRRQLIEVKGTCSRPAVRMAVGQLLDYSALEDGEPSLGLLVPEAPASDLVALLDRLGIVIISPTDGGFMDNAGGSFT